MSQESLKNVQKMSEKKLKKKVHKKKGQRNLKKV